MTNRQVAQRCNKQGGMLELLDEATHDSKCLLRFLAKEILRAEYFVPFLTENSSFSLAVEIANKLGVKTP